MSLAVKIAIVARLEGDALFCARLAADPDEQAKPALFNASKSQVPPVYPCVTFRESDAAPDSRFRPAMPRRILSDPVGAAVNDEYFDFEIWTQEASAETQDAILERIDAHLRNVAFAVAGGAVFFTERLTAQTDLYDDKTNAFFALARYRVRVEYSE